MSYPNKTIRSRSIIIASKEFREIFRDRRTVMSVIISPLLVTPLLMGLMGTMIQTQAEKAKVKTYRVGIVGREWIGALEADLKNIPNLILETIEERDAESHIKARTLNAVAIFPPDTETRLAEGRAVPIQVLQDAGDENSQMAASRIDAAFTTLGQAVLKQRLAERNLPADFATPFQVTEKAITTGGSMGTFLIAMMLPYILALSAFGGAIYAAFDQVAGEKERGTLETLLVSPASRLDIVIGKFGAVVGVCLISSLLSILGLVIAFNLRLKAFEWIAKDGLQLSPIALGVTLLVMLPLSVLFAGLLLAVSTFARNQKEAQTYLAPLFIAVLMPAMASMFLGADAPPVLALVPVLNAAIIIKQALSGSYDPTFILLAFAASAVYAALALLFATRLFQKESVLIKT